MNYLTLKGAGIQPAPFYLFYRTLIRFMVRDMPDATK